MCNGLLKGVSSAYDVDPLSNIETVQHDMLNGNENTSVASRGMWIVINHNKKKGSPKDVIYPWLYQLRVERLKVKRSQTGDE